LSGDQHIPCVGIDFNGTDGAPAEQQATEYSATSAREKSQLIHGPSSKNSHRQSYLDS
jgi:hypothetical protein